MSIYIKQGQAVKIEQPCVMRVHTINTANGEMCVSLHRLDNGELFCKQDMVFDGDPPGFQDAEARAKQGGTDDGNTDAA